MTLVGPSGLVNPSLRPTCIHLWRKESENEQSE